MSVEKEIGLILRQARESIGLSLDELQEKTNIQRPFLVAIEEGDFSKLPSPFYVRTYLRNYANHVKIEPHHILREYRKAEQAERGLTGVHQAVTQKTLAEQLRVHTAGRIPINADPQQTSVHKKTTPRTNRTSAHTALTIAKQKTGTNRGQNQTHYQTKQNIGYTAQHPDLSQTTRRHKRVDLSTTSIKRSRTSQFSQEKQQKEKVNTDRYTRIKSDVYQSLSRTRRHKKVTNTIPPTSNEEDTNRSQVTQSVTQIRSLSRRSAFHRTEKTKREKKGLGKWATQLIVAGVIICIPLLWVMVHTFADSKPEKKPAEKEQTVNTAMNEQKDTAADDQQATQSPPSNLTDDQTTEQTGVSLVTDQGDAALYQVSGSNQARIVISATGESWVQIRKQRAVQKQGYLKDSILKEGNTLKYTHDFSQSSDVWITLAIPDAVQVTVNGTPIKSVRTLHIRGK